MILAFYTKAPRGLYKLERESRKAKPDEGKALSINPRSPLPQSPAPPAIDLVCSGWTIDSLRPPPPPPPPSAADSFVHPHAPTAPPPPRANARPPARSTGDGDCDGAVAAAGGGSARDLRGPGGAHLPQLRPGPHLAAAPALRPVPRLQQLPRLPPRPR